MSAGYYYLHTNGELIWKKFIPEANSPFVRRIWEVHEEDRAIAWKIVLEALSLGAKIERIRRLSYKWGLTFEDSIELLRHAKKETVTQRMRDGLKIFIKEILGMEEQRYWDLVRRGWA